MLPLRMIDFAVRLVTAARILMRAVPLTSLWASFARIAVPAGDTPRPPFRGIALLAALGVLLLPVAGCFEESIPQVEGIEVSLTGENFDQEVLQSAVPVLVEFGASWCGPCRDMEPIIALLSQDYEGLMKVGKIDVDASPDLARQYDVIGVPAFVLFRGGDVVQRHIGTKQYSEMRQWLDPQVGTPPSPAM